LIAFNRITLSLATKTPIDHRLDLVDRAMMLPRNDLHRPPAQPLFHHRIIAVILAHVADPSAVRAPAL
jgi:hypothetical protein